MNGHSTQGRYFLITMIRRKTDNVNMFIKCRVKQKFKDFGIDLRERLQLTWADIIMNGFKYSVEEEQKIGNAVILNCYIHCYQRKDYFVAMKKRAKVNYKDMYIFWITRSNDNKYNVYYKHDLDSDIILYKMSKRRLPQALRDNFFLEIDDLIPQ